MEDAFPSVVCPITCRPPLTVADPAESAVAVVVARVEVLVTVRVPPTVSLLVTVEVPTVCVLAVKYVVTAFVVVELPMMILVMLASVERSDEKNPLVVVELVEVINHELDELRVVVQKLDLIPQCLL